MDAEATESGIGSVHLVRSRRAARVAALSALYQRHIARCYIEKAVDEAIEREQLAPETASFARELAVGVVKHLHELERLVGRRLASGWRLERLAVVDHMILLIAAYELYHVENVPPKVTISEAVILAKKYGDVESGRFVNGLLANLLNDSPKREWDPSRFDDVESPEPDPEPEPEPVEEVVREGTPEYEEVRRVARWTLRREEG